MKNRYLNFIKQHILVTILIALAALALLIGIIIPVRLHNKILFDSNFSGTFFSLASIFMFSAALVYQVKEYKLQVEELKKSVEAQTESSKALDSQRQLMVDQNTNEFIFNLIENFNRFKLKVEIQSSLEHITTFYNDLSKNLEGLIMSPNHQKNAELFFPVLLESSHKWIIKYRFSSQIVEFAQFAFIVFDLIHENNKESKRRCYYTTIFNNQFIEQEKLLLCLINTDKSDPLYSKEVEWKFHTVVFLLHRVDDTMHSSFLKVIDVNILLNLLNAKDKSKEPAK